MEKIIKPPFIQLDFSITGKCNAKCIFCKVWKHEYYKQEDLSPKIWIDTARKINDFTYIEFVCIGGGEPLLYEGIFEVLNGLSKLNIHSVVVTNGSLFSYDNCRKIIDSGTNHIDFSIDNFAEKHDRMRGTPGLFAKCVEAILLLKKMNPKISLGVSTIICEENIYDIPKFLEWVLNELPIDAINFQAYNQLSVYEGKDWWKNDPLWPRDKGTIVKVTDYLLKKTKDGAKIANHPLHFEKFKSYFMNPDSNLNIKCPAGMFNFSVSYRGDVVGCVAEGKIGDVIEEDPVTIYRDKFSAIRKKASLCHENCHFLINCYFPLHWKRWDNLVKDMVKDNTPVAYRQGKIILPPEIREITSSNLTKDYPSLIKYGEHKHLDVIGKYGDLNGRKLPAAYPGDIPYIYLCGDTSEVHRWGSDLDENDFFKQIDKLKELSQGKAVYLTIVGVRRTNFHRLNKIYNLIREIKGLNINKLPLFNIKPLKGIKERFVQYLKQINEITNSEGIEFRVEDCLLYDLLDIIEKNVQISNFDENNFLRALGPVCKDVFSGPYFILLDLSGRCNLNCVYCRRFSPWNRKYWEGQHPELFGFIEYEMVRNVLIDAKDMGTEKVLLVGGGEPTLHPQFLDIIKLIKELGMSFNLSTNGVLLDLYNKYLINDNCESITISLSFSSEKTFKAIRPDSNPNLIQRIEKNVKDLSNLRRNNKYQHPTIIALYAICKYNYEEIIGMALHAKKLGADAIWYQLVHLEKFSKEQLYINQREIKIVKELLRRARSICKIIGLEFNSFIDFEMEHYDEQRGNWSKEGLLCQGCFVGWHFAYVHLRREVFMCCGAKTVGILHDEGKGLKGLWYSDVYQRYRNGGLIMHRENPLTLYGSPLYDSFCESCDNHDQNITMINYLEKYNLVQFVER